MGSNKNANATVAITAVHIANSICNLMAAFYLTILLGYEANQHPAVDEMRSLLGYKPKKVETQP